MASWGPSRHDRGLPRPREAPAGAPSRRACTEAGRAARMPRGPCGERSPQGPRSCSLLAFAVFVAGRVERIALGRRRLLVTAAVPTGGGDGDRTAGLDHVAAVQSPVGA